MDFSKVRLADFNQARLRDVLAGEEPAAGEKSNISGFLNVSTNFDDMSAAEASSFGLYDSPLGRVLSHAPQYSATSLSSLGVSSDLHELDVDPYTGYCLAVTDAGLSLWKQQADNRIFFALPEGHHISARFLNNSKGAARSVQPHFVLIDRKSGQITYFDSISRAVINPEVDLQRQSSPSESQQFGSYVGIVELSEPEEIEHIEIVADLGFVVATNLGHFYWINLRNDLGKISVNPTPMRHGSGMLARLRSLGAFSRDVVSIKTGRTLKPGTNGGMEYELYIINRFGDIALWHVGRDGIYELVSEVRIGPKLTAQMDILYPNSGVTLAVHDITVEDELTHILASFAPDSESSARVFVILSLNLESDVVSVRRLQTYENEVGEINEKVTKLHANSQGVLIVVTSDAFIMVDSSSKFSGSLQAGGLPPPRWEECLYLKDDVYALTSKLSRTTSVIIATTWDLIELQVSGTDTTQEAEGAAPIESTTKVRLEQAVFESSPQNPLNLMKWSQFQAQPDTNAISELALEIANASSAFVPKELPNMSVHLDLRLSKIMDLYSLEPSEPVREVAHALVAAVVLNNHGSDHNPTATQLIKLIDETALKLSPNSSVREVFLHDVLVVPRLLTEIAVLVNSNSTSSTNAKASAASLSNDFSYVLLEILQMCNANNLGVPLWATAGPLKQAFEDLTSRAGDSDDVELLTTVTDLLCSLYGATGSADSAVVRKLLFKLAELGSPYAAEIALKHSIYSALAPLEVDQWLKTNDPSTILAYIDQLDSKFADYVFETCITSQHIPELVDQLAKSYPQQVEEYLTKHKLDKIAWTLDPQSPESTNHLKLATSETTNLHDRRLYASLYKISSYITGAGSFDKAQQILDLVNIQDSLTKQFQTAPNTYSKDHSSSPITKHGLAIISQQRFLDKNESVELCALAPPQAIPETNDNFIIGFKLVGSDVLRRRLLVQQLIINNNWERVHAAAANTVSSSSQSYMHKLKQTLFYHTLQNVSAETVSLLQHFETELVAPQPEEAKATWKWETDDSVFQELSDIALRAQSISEKYNIKKLIEPLFEDSMDMAE